MAATLTDLLEREEGHRTAGHRTHRSRTLWLAALAAAFAWSLWDAGVGRRPVLNPGGWPLVTKFLRAAAHPDLSGAYLGEIRRATVTTVAYAAIGTALSVVLGVIGGFLLAELPWRRRIADPTARHRASWWIGRLVLGVPRGIHEAVWGLLLVNVLGRDPLVGVLAIALPFGAMTAKVFAELIDETAPETHRALRAAGAGRLAALAYALLPATLDDLLSYAFYRFECSIRSAVILGMIGAGGLGFLLSLAFQGLRYDQMWTVLYVLVALTGAAEAWSALVRRRRTRAVVRTSLAAAGAVLVASWWYVGLRPWALWSPRSRSLAARIADQAWPPRLPAGGWPVLTRAVRDTFQLSLVAIVVASGLAAVTAVLGARGSIGDGWAARTVAGVARLAGRVSRAVPPTCWALLVLFVVFPGTLPGALALGLYTFGIVARLFGEVLENQDPRGRDALRRLGAGPAASFAYGSLPDAGPRWLAYALYRWEVAARESVVVGMVGAGGLGRLLSKQTTAFDYRAMLVTIAALIVLTIAVDLVSTAVRRSLR